MQPPARLLALLVLPLLVPAAAPAAGLRPVPVGPEHGFDPGAARRGRPPVDVAALAPAPPRDPIPPTVIEHGPRSWPFVALTFDACPSPTQHGGFRRDIVEFLRREEVPATFFLSANWAMWRPEVVRELAADRLFEVESHGAFHADMTRWPTARMQVELERAQAVLHHLTGRAPRFFRPPRGDLDWRVAAEAGRQGLTVLLWDVVSADPEASFSPARIARNVLSTVQPGSIVIFHVNGPADRTLAALPLVLAGLREKGLVPVKLSELLADPAPSLAAAGPADG